MAGSISRKLSPSLLSKLNIGALNKICTYSQNPEAENPFMKKYADKIAALQNTSPEEFEKKMEMLRTKSATTKTEKKISAQPKSQTPTFSKNKTLDSIMKLENLEDLHKEAIESLWKEYHKDKDGLFAVLPEEAGRKILLKSAEYPTFLLPLPRPQGYEFIMSQFFGNCCHFTPLISYQTHKENAPVSMTLTYFSELLDTKGLVLMRGEYDNNVFKVHEAQCLTNQLHLYYAEDDAKKNKLLRQFNKEPQSFKHMDLVSNLETSVGKC